MIEPHHHSRSRATLTILVGGLLLLATALGAQFALNGIIARYDSVLQTRVGTQSDLYQINIAFKDQVQEWKNTLLRGHNTVEREKYWAAFVERESQVRALMNQLNSTQLSDDTRQALQRFARAHRQLAGKYRQGYEVYLANGQQWQLVDDLLRGIDREPSNKLYDFTHALEAEIAEQANTLRDSAETYFISTLLVVLISSVAVALGVISIVRNAIETEVGARTRSDFLAKMSHEIRTPMNGVLGMSELLSSTPLTEQQKRYNQAIHSSGQSLLILINDLLDYARIESGKMSIESSPFSLSGVLSNLYYLFVQKATERELEWHIDMPPSVPDGFVGDSARINQILVNLVGNAFKFTEQGGVTLHVTYQNDLLTFECTDTGIGMDEHTCQHLFEPYVQADNSIHRRYGGTGLGLVISRELARQMNGELVAESQVNAGSTFRLSLPLPRGEELASDFGADKPTILLCVENELQREDYQRYCNHWGLPSRIVRAEDDVTEADAMSVCVIDVSDHHRSDELARAYSALGHLPLQLYDVGQSSEWINSRGDITRGFKDRPPFGALLKPLLLDCLQLEHLVAQCDDPHLGIRPLSILAVDDNSVNRTVVSAMLAKLGHRCTLACDGEDAVTQFLNTPRRFDLVLMDCEMPVLDGMGALKCIREIEQQKAMAPTPVLALTANAYETDRERYLNGGMDDVLTKPISLNRLKSALRKHAL